MIEQARLCAVWPMENWLGSSMNHMHCWMTVWICYWHAPQSRSLSPQQNNTNRWGEILAPRAHFSIEESPILTPLNSDSDRSRSQQFYISLLGSWCPLASHLTSLAVSAVVCGGGETIVPISSIFSLPDCPTATDSLLPACLPPARPLIRLPACVVLLRAWLTVRCLCIQFI